MRNLLEDSSVAQSLDGDRLTGSLRIPDTRNLDQRVWWCKSPPAGIKLRHVAALGAGVMGDVARTRAMARVMMIAGSMICTTAIAQTPVPKGKVDTKIAGVSAFVRPPASFNPLTATAAELDRYGFPPRPSRELGPDVAARWESRVMSQTRIIPQLLQTTTVHSPAKSFKQTRTTDNLIEGTSENWSGYVIVDKSNPFLKPGSQVEAQWVVPKPVSGCGSGSETYSSANWVGIDGAFSNDVLQAGTETDLNCKSGPTYYAWIEWFPNSEIRITNLTVSPGDLVSVSVFIASDGSKHLSVENLTTRKSVALAMTPPPGTELVGNSIEWILERPTINNKAFSKLTNYLLNPWTNISAVTFPNGRDAPVNYLPNASPADATIYRLSMNDGTKTISGVELFSIPGATAKAAPSLWFVATTPY